MCDILVFLCTTSCREGSPLLLCLEASRCIYHLLLKLVLVMLVHESENTGVTLIRHVSIFVQTAGFVEVAFVCFSQRQKVPRSLMHYTPADLDIDLNC